MQATLNVDYNERLKKGDPVDGALARRLVRAGLASADQQPAEPAPLERFDADGDGAPGGSTAPEPSDDLTAARRDYRDALGKAPFPGWGVEELRRRIAEAG